MRERWRKRFDRDLPASNRRQALLPQGARKLANRHGSAPGAYVTDARGRWTIMLPGVPRELRGMVDDTLLPVADTPVILVFDGADPLGMPSIDADFLL